MEAANAGPPAGSEDPSGEDAPGEASILVSEFPPPPSYYRHFPTLTPPPIPHEALTRGTQRAAAVAARARAESEKLRLGDDADKTDAILGGVPMDQEEEEEEGDVVAVFGETVEDALQVEPLDRCEDPRVVRDEVRRLNQQILQDFVKLVQDLVHRPLDNKKTRDELSHAIFLMLQECNKFREHQARELLIELLEHQLTSRKKLLSELHEIITEADKLLKDSSES